MVHHNPSKYQLQTISLNFTDPPIIIHKYSIEIITFFLNKFKELLKISELEAPVGRIQAFNIRPVFERNCWNFWRVPSLLD